MHYDLCVEAHPVCQCLTCVHDSVDVRDNCCAKREDNCLCPTIDCPGYKQEQTEVTKQALDAALSLHDKWLRFCDDGKKLSLRNKYITYQIMRDANMANADLFGVCIAHTIACFADFSSAEMSVSNLMHANLQASKCDKARMVGARLDFADLRDASMRECDLSYASMQNAQLNQTDLLDAILYKTDMRGADIDNSAWPLRKDSLTAYVDDRIAVQLLYHALAVIQKSPYVSSGLKKALLTSDNVNAANRCHNAAAFGLLSTYRAEDYDDE